MLHLTLAGLSADNKRLLLVSDTGEEYSLTIDRHLRAALRGEHARLGQLEIQMESTLRPRDIQTRIRAGESPESVAQAAQTTVEKILPFANPVLAERAHIAQRAQRASVRRKAGDQGARTLGEAVAAQLSPLGVSTEVVEWDSWRREDGRWALTGDYTVGKRKGSAKFAFDAPGNYVTVENDDARWLVGEQVSGSAKPERRDDLKQARQRRLSAVPEDELPLGDDAIEIANETAAPQHEVPRDRAATDRTATDPTAADAGSHTADEESTVDLTETAERVRAPEADEEPALSPTPEPLAETPDDAEAPSSSKDSDDDRAAAAQEVTEPKPARKPARKKGRASVPSWDEIMFGGGKQD
ncbi:septation protein SepH [Nocardioides sp. JQ2195]|uniref:septation protein SepH n=1 Tax=Nocardioides sp. JQ2195 TaxID=2592334 RepID=UPI00197E940F|nr:septation protein SepH [Nocardioides sp. JQ2195]